MERKIYEFKPCPFCGWGTIVEIPTFLSLFGFNSYTISCNSCGAMTKAYKTKEEAVAAWNMRSDEYAKDQLIFAAPEMYDELYEALQLLQGKSSYDGDEFSKQAESIRELLARIDGEETTAHEGTD